MAPPYPSSLSPRELRMKTRSGRTETSGPKDPEQKSSNGVKRRRRDDITGRKQKMAAAVAAVAGGRSLSDGEQRLAARPLRLTSGKQKDWVVVRNAEGKLQAIEEDDFPSDLPTLASEVKDPETVNSIKNLQESDMIMDKARSIVRISSTDPDGTVQFQCTGIVYEFDEATKTAKILTSSLICSYDDELWHIKQKVLVHLSNDTSVEARFLFYNNHYRVALLQIEIEELLVPASFGYRPEYDEEVFVLGRNDEYHLIVRHTSVLRIERPFTGRIHYMFCRDDSPVACTGGAVMNKDGKVIGMIATHCPQAAIISMSTVSKCIDTWYKFGHIAHPVHDLDLKSVRMLDIIHRDELSVGHNIRHGFIVDKVLPESTAETIGIRRGDVIDVIDLIESDNCTTLPKLEDYFIGLSWRFLEQKLDPCSTINLEIHVYNLRNRERVRTFLPMQFEDATVTQHDSGSLFLSFLTLVFKL